MTQAAIVTMAPAQIQRQESVLRRHMMKTQQSLMEELTSNGVTDLAEYLWGALLEMEKRRKAAPPAEVKEITNAVP